MLEDGVIRKYAIREAKAALFYGYIPDTTFALDIFYMLNSQSGNGLDYFLLFTNI